MPYKAADGDVRELFDKDKVSILNATTRPRDLAVGFKQRPA